MERVERKAFCFSINGEFITQLAKERFFMEGADYENVMELLLSCMCGTEMSDQELKRRAEDVLLGRAEFAGDTADGSFCMRTYDAEDKLPEVPEYFNIFTSYAKLKKKLKRNWIKCGNGTASLWSMCRVMKGTLFFVKRGRRSKADTGIQCWTASWKE